MKENLINTMKDMLTISPYEFALLSKAKYNFCLSLKEQNTLYILLLKLRLYKLVRLRGKI